MTEKQLKLLKYLKGYIKKNEIPPTLTEMKSFMGNRALSTIHQHLEALISKGYVYRDRKNSPRCYYPDPNPPISYEDVKRFRQKNYFEV